MSANVETMFYTGATPWHGLGEKLESAPTISEAIEQSGLDWEVGLNNANLYSLIESSSTPSILFEI